MVNCQLVFGGFMLTQEQTREKYNEKQLFKNINASFFAVVAQQSISLILQIGVVFFAILMLSIFANIYSIDYNEAYKNLSDLFSTKSTIGLILTILMYVFFIFLPYAFYLVIRKKKISSVMSFKPPKPLQLLTGVFISLGFFVIGKIISGIILLVLQFLKIPPRDIPLDVPSGILNIILFTIMIAILPPLLEEFAFRGVILGETKGYNPALAVLISAFAFSFMHGTISQIPYAFTFGLAIGYFVIKFNSIWIGIITHFIVNGWAVILSLLEKNINQNILNLISLGVDFIFFSLAIIFIIVFFMNNKISLSKTQNSLPFGRALVSFFRSPLIYIFILLTVVMVFISGYLNV